jgi:hypothetical protein
LAADTAANRVADDHRRAVWQLVGGTPGILWREPTEHTNTSAVF